MKIALALTTAAIAFAASPATIAAAPDSVDTVIVQFADLNLERPEGIAALFARIKTAAKRVCDSRNGERLAQKDQYAACIELAISTAVARVDRPGLSDYVAAKAPVSRKPANEKVASR